MDLWDKAHDVVIGRLQKEGMLAGPGSTSGFSFTAGAITYETEPPKRTDFGETAAPKLRARMHVGEPGPYMSRADMFEVLLSEKGPTCQSVTGVVRDLTHGFGVPARGLGYPVLYGITLPG